MQTRIINNDFHIQDMAKRAKLTTQQVLESWESFDTDIGGEVDEWEQPDNTREPVMPGSDDEFSDLEENLVEEEEENHMELETEIVQDVVHGETSESAVQTWRKMYNCSCREMRTHRLVHFPLSSLEMESHGLLLPHRLRSRHILFLQRVLSMPFSSLSPPTLYLP